MRFRSFGRRRPGNYGTVDEVQALIDGDSAYHLVDVRTREEYDGGYIPTATWIPRVTASTRIAAGILKGYQRDPAHAPDPPLQIQSVSTLLQARRSPAQVPHKSFERPTGFG